MKIIKQELQFFSVSQILILNKHYSKIAVNIKKGAIIMMRTRMIKRVRILFESIFQIRSRWIFSFYNI